MIWLCSVLWLAGVLEAEVTPITAWPRPAPLALDDRPLLQLVATDMGVVVDGRRDEPAWRDAGLVPALGPWVEGVNPGTLDLSLLLTPGGLVITAPSAPELPLELVLDPNGLGATWWRVVLDAGAARLARCSVDGLDLPISHPVRQQAVPCEPVEGLVAARDQVWEVLLPLSLVGPLTASGRLLLATGGRREGGTWAPRGLVARVPELGLPLAPSAGRVRVDFTSDGAWRLHLRSEHAAPWRVSRYRRGQLVSTDLLSDGAMLPAIGSEPVELEVLWHAQGPVAATSVRRVSPGRAEVALLDALSDGVVRLRVHTPEALDAVALVVRSVGGRVLTRGEVSLPAGNSEVRVDWSWRGRRAVLELEGLGRVPLLRAPSR